MRDAVCRALADLYRDHPFIFLTGDLGFMALEPLRAAMGEHFVNAGVAEQNMVTVAAGIASTGTQVWTYSIASFLYARPFEQIRNDVCMHGFDVKFIGNGGGYAYGPMGPSHHALEDYGVLQTLPNMHIYAPSFAQDIPETVSRAARLGGPAYVRLGRCEKPAAFTPPAYAPWRKLSDGDGPVLVGVGPLVAQYLEACAGLAMTRRPQIWTLAELPLDADSIPPEFWAAVRRAAGLLVVEEHVVHGSAGQALAHLAALNGVHLRRFRHLHACGYPSRRFGSQRFHREECGLDINTVLERIAEMTS